MPTKGGASASKLIGWVEMNARYDFVWAPFGGAEDGSVVGLPHSQWAFCVEPPKDQPAIGVASQQARVAAQKRDAVDVGSVAAEDVGGLGGMLGRLLAVEGIGRWGGHATEAEKTTGCYLLHRA